MPASTTRADAVRAAFLRHADAALAALDDPERSPDERAHAVRKALKRARAALRLLRPALGERRFRARNAALRDAGRALSTLRDAKVIARTLRRFTGVRGAGAPEYANFRAALRRERDAAEAALAAGRAPRDVRRAVLAARRAVVDAPRPDPRSLADELRGTYRRARRALDAAREHTTPETLHAWRKRVKAHEGALEALRGAGGTKTRGELRELRRLARLLGDDHDAAVLAGRARTGDVARQDLERLLAKIDRVRARLARDAFVLGRRRYREAPRAYARRVAGPGAGRGPR